MHGVKRLFAWMIPRFDPARFEVSLVSLRKKDLSEETLDALGIDITYLHKSKFDPATLPALLKIIDRKKIDVLHLHGYGATTFGRMAAAMRGIPAILHEHANLTDTPWFQKIADRLLERYTDIAIAVSKSTADFVVKARLVQPEKVKVVYLGAPHEEFSRARSSDEIAAARRELGIRPAISRSARSRGCTSRRATPISSMPRGWSSIESRTRSSSSWARGRCASRSKRRRAGSASAIGSSSSDSRAMSRRAECVRSERVSVAVGRHAADRVRSAGRGQTHRRHRRRRAARHPDRRTRRAHRAQAQRAARSPMPSSI